MPNPLPAAIALLSWFALSAPAQTLQTTALPSGDTFTSSATTLQVTALRDDVLRVRATHTGALPEDASWAVLPAARTSTVTVTQDAHGFHTAKLRVTVSPDLRLTVTDLAGTILQQDAQPIDWRPHGFRLYKQKFPDDHFFGLGDKPGPLDRAGEDFVMWNTDNYGWQESTDPIYKSIPFFIDFRAGHALGVLFDNTFRTFFDFGRELPGQYSYGAPDGPLDYYLLYGPEPKQVVETYAWLTGPTPLPPLWSLGFQQSRYTYQPEARLLEVAQRLRTDKIPTDALYLDIDFQEKNRPFTIDQAKFPNFPQLVQTLKQEDFHLVVITDLHIAHLPNAGYAPYDSGIAEDRFVKNPDSSVYIGPVWPGPSVFPDFTQSATRAWWGTLYKPFAAMGVSGFWNDMNEPAVFVAPTKTMPDDTQHRIDEPGFAPRTATHLEIHNVFGMENSRATYDGLLAIKPNERPFVLTRATYAGGQRYAATWTGDNSSTWNHLRQTTPQILNLGLSGFAIAGADVGGFAGSPPPDLLTKWLEVAAFQPIDRDHSEKGTRDHEPWVDGPAQEAIRRRYIEERYRLMPYLYTLAEESSRTGLPIVRPLFLEFPNATTDGHPLDLDATAEFLLGPSLLIAPSPSPEEIAPYRLYLPPGLWYDYWTGQPVQRSVKSASRDLEQPDDPGALPRDAQSSTTKQAQHDAQQKAKPEAQQEARQEILKPLKPIMITPALADLPVYVREGTILPITPLTQSTSEIPQGPLTLRVYPGENCHGDLYQDDGKTFAFRQGQFFRQHLTCKQNPDGSLALHLDASQGDYSPWWKTLRIEAYGWTPTRKQATLANKFLPLQQSTSAWSIEIPASRAATDLLLQ